MEYYKDTYKHGIDVKNTGFDYKNKIFQKTTSNRMWANSTMSGFLEKLNGIVAETIDSVKRIRTFWNYTVDKDDRTIN